MEKANDFNAPDGDATGTYVPDGARSSVGERSVHTGEVAGSIPAAPTIALKSGPIRRRNPVPDIQRVGMEWRIPDFQPAPPAFNWREYERKVGTLYIVECAGFIKIGLATDFKKRFNGIDTACPLPVTKVATRTVPLAGLAYAEAWLHDQFDDRRIKGEWFAISQKEALAAMPKAIRRAEVYDLECRLWNAHQERISAEEAYQFREWLECQPESVKQMELIDQLKKFDREAA